MADDSEGRSHVRKRAGATQSRSDKKDGDTKSTSKDAIENRGKVQSGDRPTSTPADRLQPGSYWLTRIVFTRAIGFIYCMTIINRFILENCGQLIFTCKEGLGVTYNNFSGMAGGGAGGHIQ